MLSYYYIGQNLPVPLFGNRVMKSGTRYQEELVMLLRRWDGLNACNEEWYEILGRIVLLLRRWDGMNACNGERCEISGRIDIAVKILGWYECS